MKSSRGLSPAMQMWYLQLLFAQELTNSNTRNVCKNWKCSTPNPIILSNCNLWCYGQMHFSQQWTYSTWIAIQQFIDINLKSMSCLMQNAKRCFKENTWMMSPKSFFNYSNFWHTKEHLTISQFHSKCTKDQTASEICDSYLQNSSTSCRLMHPATQVFI